MPFIYGFNAFKGVCIMNDVYKKIDEIISPKKIIEEGKEKDKQEYSLDTIQEQIESPMTSIRCPESIKDKELKLIDKYPENYIEINFIKKIRIVDSFYIPSNIKKFNYGEIEYNIVEENIYILPSKKGYFMPTCFYKEEIVIPIDFKQKNKGISGKALSLLYDPGFYTDLFSSEEGKYNLFIVVLLIISISSFIIGLYFVLSGGI